MWRTARVEICLESGVRLLSPSVVLPCPSRIYSINRGRLISAYQNNCTFAYLFLLVAGFFLQLICPRFFSRSLSPKNILVLRFNSRQGSTSPQAWVQTKRTLKLPIERPTDRTAYRSNVHIDCA